MRKKILLVDDSETALMAVGMILKTLPVDLVLARNGEEGVAVARRERPDLILMDVVMPKMTGFVACEALREYPETQSIPVIMVTSRNEPDCLERGYVSGCSDYIVKPVDRLELIAKLKSYVDLENT